YEVESALVDNPKVAEAAVVAKTDPVVGQAITAFVTLKGDQQPSDEVAAELREHVAKVIGKIARPHHIIFSDDLPKTRSGKIMRRLLRDVAEGGALCGHLGDVENALAGMIAGTVAPSAGVQQVQELVQELQADAQQLQQEGRGDLGALATDLSQAVEQVRAALASGGDVLTALGS